MDLEKSSSCLLVVAVSWARLLRVYPINAPVNWALLPIVQRGLWFGDLPQPRTHVLSSSEQGGPCGCGWINSSCGATTPQNQITLLGSHFHETSSSALSHAWNRPHHLTWSWFRTRRTSSGRTPSWPKAHLGLWAIWFSV